MAQISRVTLYPSVYVFLATGVKLQLCSQSLLLRIEWYSQIALIKHYRTKPSAVSFAIVRMKNKGANSCDKCFYNFFYF